MTENLDDCDGAELDESELPVLGASAVALFGEYTVLSPGVEIVLEGRPVSAPAAE